VKNSLRKGALYLLLDRLCVDVDDDVMMMMMMYCSWSQAFMLVAIIHVFGVLFSLYIQ